MLNFGKTARLLIASGLLFALAHVASAVEPRIVESSPESFFASHRPVRPTLLIPIGLSGSGKTFWSEIGRATGWEHIDVDQVIADEIDESIARKNLKADIDADPRKAALENAQTLRKRGYRVAKEQADALLKAKHSFIWDSLGFDSVRKELMEKARSRSFEVWWLIFDPEDWKRNRVNLFFRESKGEPLKRPVAEHCAQLGRLLKQQAGNLRELLADIKKKPSLSPDRIFFARVADMSTQLPGGDPCIGADD